MCQMSQKQQYTLYRRKICTFPYTVICSTFLLQFAQMKIILKIWKSFTLSVHSIERMINFLPQINKAYKILSAQSKKI